MKSIFILGGSRLQVPAIKKAKEKGLFVYVLDYDPKAVGIQYADKFLEISTIDKEAVYRASMEYKPDFITTSVSDMPVRTVSWVCERLGKKTDISYEGAICATDKVSMRKRMKKCGVPIPLFYEIRSLDELLDVSEKLSNRFILKPADNSASRGVVLVNRDQCSNIEEVYEYCLKYSRSGEVLAEEFMEGPEVSVEAFSIEGEPHIITITDKIVTKKPYFVELGHTQPSRLSLPVQADIQRVADMAIRAIGMKNGPTHTEIKVTEDGAKLVEIAARLGGDCITSHLVPLSTGVDMIECSINTLLGETVNVEQKAVQGAAIRFMQSGDGILSEISGIEKALKMPGVKDIAIYKDPGDTVRSLRSSNDRIGHVIAVGKDANEAAYNADTALENICLKIEA